MSDDRLQHEISALRWLLNITTEFDRKDVRTRQAARLLDEYGSGTPFQTNREQLESLWRRLTPHLGHSERAEACKPAMPGPSPDDDLPPLPDLRGYQDSYRLEIEQHCRAYARAALAKAAAASPAGGTMPASATTPAIMT